MSFVKSPYFPAVICVIVLAIVFFMLFRDVNSMKSTMTDLVNQHNNAQKALENHSGAIKRLQDMGHPMLDEEEYDEDDGDYDEYQGQAALPAIKEEPMDEPAPPVPTTSGKRSKKDT